jgi:hypothetical protein
MLFHDIEWQPASTCSIDSFDGSVEAVAGGSGYAGGGGGNNGANSGGSAVDYGQAALDTATSLAAIAALAVTPAAAIPLTVLVGGQAVIGLANQANQAVAGTLSQDPNIAAQQLTAFAGTQ